MSKFIVSIKSLFSTASIRSSLALIVTFFTCYVIFMIVNKSKISTEDMAVMGQVITLDMLAIQYYFGTSKSETDRSKARELKGKSDDCEGC